MSQPLFKCDSCTRQYFSEYEAVMCAIDDAHTNLQGYRDVPRLDRLQTLIERLDKLDYFLKTNPEQRKIILEEALKKAQVKR